LPKEDRRLRVNGGGYPCERLNYFFVVVNILIVVKHRAEATADIPIGRY